MKKSKPFFIVCLIAFWTLLSFRLRASGEFTLLKNGSETAQVLLLSKKDSALIFALGDLRSDLKKIAGDEVSPTLSSKIFVANLADIDFKRDKAFAKLDSLRPLLEGQWENYRVFDHQGNLYIVGSDSRGTMFGIYHFIEEYLKVDPMYYWSGIEPEKRSDLTWDFVNIKGETPSFKFRGWFINDEDLLTFWKDGGTRNLDYKFYGSMIHPDIIEAAVEALVRSRYNLFIPASFINILNPAEENLVRICARRGVFVSQHHQEPMGVSPFAFFDYWKKKGRDVPYSYVTNREEIKEVWRKATEKWASYPNVIWQLGLRGIGDRAVWNADKNIPDSDEYKGGLISGAIRDQMDILRQVCPAGRTIRTSMTLWAEGSVLNRKGLLTFPEEAIIVFADNSPGWKWQEDFYTTPRNPQNAYGVYYHHALIGSGPHLAQVVPPEQTFGLLKIAVVNQSSDYLMINVGNIREFVLGIAATSDMAWDMASFDPANWLERWIAARFDHGKEQIANAYRIYFNAFQIHERQQVPFLMDGQMSSLGKTTIQESRQMLAGKKTGNDVAREHVEFRGTETGGMAARAEKDKDAFWESLKDMHPESAGRREAVKSIAYQRAGFQLSLLHANSVKSGLSKKENSFLYDNLIFPSSIMLGYSQWLEQILLAREALGLGDTTAAIAFTERAKAALKVAPDLVSQYSQGKWERWYRGERILNLSLASEETESLLKALESAQPQK